MNETSPTIHSVTEGGVTSDHATVPVAQAFVAPTHSQKQHNTLKPALIPFACWRANDMRFDFGLSFVKPEITSELSALNRLIDLNTVLGKQESPNQAPIVRKPVLTVFGHTDSTGNDDFNKTLSGRRAQAIYAMLVRDVKLWEELYSNPFGDDKWEPQAIHTMQRTLSQPLSDHPSAGKRKELFLAYMDHLCTIRDETGQPVLDGNGQIIQLKLDPADFLASGADRRGKGDFQGCGEFNPVLLFSEAQNKEFSDPEKKKDRDRENGPNRRVLIFLFKPGTHIDPSEWPCPRVSEGVAGCKKRFFSNADERRRSQAQPRKYSDTPDTFACRFYDRLSNNSPCERMPTDRLLLRIDLLDQRGNPIANEVYTLDIDDVRVTPNGKTTDGKGHLEHLIQINSSRGILKVRNHTWEFTIGVLAPIEDQLGGQTRLANLSFLSGKPSNSTDGEATFAFRTFQRRFNLEPSGVLDEATIKKLKDLHTA